MQKPHQCIWPLDNVKSNPAYETEVAARIPIHQIEMYRRKNFRFYEWEPGNGTPDSGDTGSEVWHIVATPSTEIQDPRVEIRVRDPWLRDYKDNKFLFIVCLVYNRDQHTSALTVVDRDHISMILQECHECPYMGHMSEDRTKERVARTAWWPKWEQDLSEYIITCERCQKANRKHGEKYGLLKHIEEPKNPWETIGMDWVTGLVPVGKENFNTCLIIVDRLSNSTNLYNTLGTKQAFSTAYHPQTDRLAERMIQKMEDIIRRFFAYGMEYEDHEGYTHFWVTLLPEVQLAYNTGQSSTTGK
ncbi:hypothetical protein O181_054456 [Austropuccinia psidii MF-1]|uniref:Integrase zinc-binding domain-containing protein n=1 Tax=Austropuccinia psidii MF-1 TaxID=1389203 RepID=A0A9Q3E2K7_9BASI|nr:hypothetical protein [Austropuccinia psidii MF-1]